jgi:branched-chain amino acid transport system substrate-binding protein
MKLVRLTAVVAVLGSFAVAMLGSVANGAGGKTVDLYSSLPLQGASKAQLAALVNGIKLSLSQAHNRAGQVTIKYQSLDDSTAQAGNWDPGKTAQNARKVAGDKNAIGYIGEFNSGATEVSLPILNQAGIPQVSPANTYVGITTNEPGSAPGEPQKYYPTGKRTYLRIVPRDTIQAAALLSLMKANGCKNVALTNDKDTYGAGLGRLIQIQAAKKGIHLLGNQGIDKTAANYRSLAAKFKSQKADCFVFAGVTANGAIQLYKDINAALPNAKLYGGDGVCESGLTNPKKKGIPAAVGKHFQCTVATQNLAAYPGGKKFLAAYTKAYHDAHPDPYAIYGYEAGSLFIDTLTKLGAKATDKGAVLKALFATKNRKSVLGTYSFDKNGDTTATAYGVYKVGSDGNPTFEKRIG